MPYALNADLPARIRSRYSDRCQSVFRKTWNADYDRHGDETRAFRIAHAAARNCEEAMTVSAKAAWTSAYINDLRDSSFACIDAGGKKDDEGKTVPRSLRHYPHHDASGALDLPHLRNALSRIAQSGTADCGVAHLRAHARAAGVGQ